MAKSVKVTGVIFQYNLETIVFEFSTGDEDEAIGVVKPKDLQVGPLGRCIFKDATSVDQMSKYVQAGDEIECEVVKCSTLDKFAYFEEEEEIGEDDKVTVTKQEVEIQPNWVAEKAKLIKGKTLDKEEIGEIEEQLGKEFDDELKDQDESKKESPRVEVEGDEKNVRKRRKTKEQQKNQEDLKPLKSEPLKVEERRKLEDNHFEDKAIIVQLRKPANETLKVSTGTVRMMKGKYSGKTFNISGSNMYLWGHHLANASLMNHIKHGDECSVRYTLPDGSNKGLPPIIKRVWIGPTTERKVKAKDDAAFAKWLANRGLDESTFLKWVEGSAPNKPYFPFVADIHESTVIAVVREKVGSQGIAVKIGQVIKKNPVPITFYEDKEEDQPAPPGDEREKDDSKNNKGTDEAKQPNNSEEVKDVDKNDEDDEEINMVLDFNIENDLEDLISEKPERKDDDSQNRPVRVEGSLALLLPEDFYVCGVAVGETDLRLLVRPGDKINIQVTPMNAALKRRFKGFNEVRPDLKLSHSAYLGYVGKSRPKHANGDVKIADGLKEFLMERGLDVEEFEALKTRKKLEADQQSLPIIQATQVPSTSNFAKVALANNVTTRAINLESEDDPRIANLLNSVEEIDVAITLSKILTSALIKQMQSKMRGKITQQISGLNKASLDSQGLQISAAQKALKGLMTTGKKQNTPAAAIKTLPAPSPMMPIPFPAILPTPQPAPNELTTRTIENKLKEVEQKMLDEAVSKAAAVAVKKTTPSRDMKKILQSYKKKGPEEYSEMTPLQYLRHYWKNELRIKMDMKKINFGQKSFNRNHSSGFRISDAKGIKPEYYSLKDLHVLMEKRKLSFEKYMRHCRTTSTKCVGKKDRKVAIDYISGKTNEIPKQVEQRAIKSKYFEKDVSAKVKLQMEMLESNKTQSKGFDLPVHPVSAAQPAQTQFNQQFQTPFFNAGPALQQQPQPLASPWPANQESLHVQGQPTNPTSRLDYFYQMEKERQGRQDRGRSDSPGKRPGVVLYDSKSRSRSPRSRVLPAPVPIGSSMRSAKNDYDPFCPTESPPGSPSLHRSNDLRMEIEQRKWQEERNILHQREDDRRRLDQELERERMQQLERERDEAERRRVEDEKRFRQQLEEERRQREVEERRRREEEERKAENERKAREDFRKMQEVRLRQTLEIERARLAREKELLEQEKLKRLEEEKRIQEQESKRRKELEEREKMFEEAKKRDKETLEQQRRNLTQERMSLIREMEEKRRQEMELQERREQIQQEEQRISAFSRLSGRDPRMTNRDPRSRQESAPVIDITDDQDDLPNTGIRGPPSPPRLSADAGYNQGSFYNWSDKSRYGDGGKSQEPPAVPSHTSGDRETTKGFASWMNQQQSTSSQKNTGSNPWSQYQSNTGSTSWNSGDFSRGSQQGSAPWSNSSNPTNPYLSGPPKGNERSENMWNSSNNSNFYRR